MATAHLISPFIFRHLKIPKTGTLILDPQSSPISSNLQNRPTRMQAHNRPARKNPKRSSYGTSRRSILKKSYTQEQVVFTTPVSNDPVVGIIGGGMAGLVCSLYLEKGGIRSTVFDTGMHGLGGRMATRIYEPQQLIFDHAAQFFTASDPQFIELVNRWLENGLIRQWQGIIGELEAGGQFTPLHSSSLRYVGINGMRPLADSILSEAHMVNVMRPCWINTLEPFNGKWHLSANGKLCGQFDAIVIAHNGKCANRLLSSSGLPLIARQMKRLELSSIWALLAAFEDPLPFPGSSSAFPFEGAFVKGIDAVSWMANNSKKLSANQGGGPHCWTFFSTAAFGKRNKVPQENIPNTTAERVKTSMLEGVEIALGLSEGSLKKPFYTRLQLWGAALPTNSPGIPCIFDPYGRAGICGDWLLGSNLEAAAISGMAMANHIADYFQSGGARPDDFSVGLHTEFQQLHGFDIGQFPGLNPEKRIDNSQAYCDVYIYISHIVWKDGSDDLMLQDRLRRKPILEEFLQHFIHFSEPHEVLKVLACKHDVFPDHLTEDPLIKAAFSQSKACHLLSSKICPQSITLEIYKALILSVNRYNLLQQCNLDLNYSIHRAKAL